MFFVKCAYARHIRTCMNLYRYFSRSKCLSISEDRGTLINNLSHHYGNLSNKIPFLLQKLPVMENYNTETWRKRIDAFVYYGFQVSDCLLILNKEPQILQLPVYLLKETLQAWYRMHLGSDFVQLILINHPQVLFIPPTIIENRLQHLQQFSKKPKMVTRLILQCPNLLTEQWSQIQSKVDYLVDVMRVDNSEFFNSCALNKPFEHIKLRHTLLLKCGLYETPSQYEHKRLKNEKSSFRNPSLKRIMDSEDNTFAKRICKITLEEYNTFKALLEKEELEQELNSDTDSDTDSDLE